MTEITHQDWPALINLARNGDDEALGLIITQLQEYLLVVANQGLSDNLQAKFGASDVVQQSLIEAQQSIASFNGNSEGEIRAWLKKIVLHNLVDSARRYTNTRSRDSEREIPFENIGQTLPCNGETPSWFLRQDEIDLQLLTALNQLPERQRQVVEQRHRFGRTYEEIAAELGATEVAVRKLWSRAIKKLRHLLASDHGSTTTSDERPASE